MLKKFDLTKIFNIQNGIILFCVFVIGIMTLLLQKEEQYLKDNRNWLELKKCYSTDYSSLDELTVVNTGMFSDKNRWEVSKLTQNVHSGFFNTYQELAKRAYVAKKYTLKTFTGIPSFKEIFGDRLNISDIEINQFLDQNPGLLSGAANTSEEKRKAVETYLLGTELQEKTKEYLADYAPKELENPYFVPCPPALNFEEKAGVLISEDLTEEIKESNKRLDFFVNPAESFSRRSWLNIKNYLTKASTDMPVKIHFLGENYTDLEISAQCMISSGGLPWDIVISKIMESPAGAPGEIVATISRELSSLNIIDEPAHSKCITESRAYRSKIGHFKQVAMSVFKQEFKFRPYLFINGKMFVHYERGENPYIVKKYLSELR